MRYEDGNYQNSIFIILLSRMHVRVLITQTSGKFDNLGWKYVQNPQNIEVSLYGNEQRRSETRPHKIGNLGAFR